MKCECETVHSGVYCTSLLASIKKIAFFYIQANWILFKLELHYAIAYEITSYYPAD